MQGLPDNKIALTTRELLPHVFTFVPPQYCGGIVIFCGTFCSRSPLSRGRDPALHRCIALCCPDFPILPTVLWGGSIARFIATSKIRNTLRRES